jgi:serine/threonine-protein kinase
MFLDEARLASRIAHPNVVQTLDIVEAEEEIFLVMQYVHGATLAQLARTSRNRGERIPPFVSTGMVCGILQGLHAAHEARDARGKPLDLIHRDVSPHNALVGADGVTRLLDFGVAKASFRLQTTREGQLKGKLAYMAPEQARGELLDRRTDLFAASVVLWEVLTGRRLFHAENEADVLSRVLTAEVPRPSAIVSDLPPSLDRVVLKGLERDPSKRYATAVEMAAELDACVGVASPTEIGEWVERTGGDELRKRALRIAEMERSAAGAASDLPRPETPPSLGPFDRFTPLSTRAYAWETIQGESVRKGSTSPTVTRPKPRLAMTMLALPGAAAAMLIMAGVSALSSGHANALSESRTLGTKVDWPSMPAAVSPLPELVAAPTTPPATAPVSSPAASTRRPGGVWTTLMRSGAAPAGSFAPSKANCNPPYTTDAKGHVHFKPNCL